MEKEEKRIEKIVSHENTETRNKEINNNIETIETIENERAEPCVDCDTRSQLDNCKNGCELLDETAQETARPSDERVI